MPLAGGFVSRLNLKKRKKNSLKTPFCENCLLLQVKDSVTDKILFKNYKYSSSTIPSLQDHFKSYSEKIKKQFYKKSVKLLEFGANDGVLLLNFKNDKKYFCLGVDPAKNIAKLGKKKSKLFCGTIYENNQKK